MSNKTLNICPDLQLPLDIITMRTAEYGDSGSGKTAFARLIAEKVHEASHRFCAIDLKNDWWGLQSSADGSAAGIPVVIFGGPRASVKILPDPAAALTLADTVASIDQSVVIDLDAMSRTAQEKFLAPFLDRLYEANRRPLLLICDEADRYAPQKPMSQEAIMSLSSSEDIARRGRKRGVGSMWLTQRTAVLNKNVSEFANLTVVFRTPGEKDLNELEDRVGRIASKDIVKEVMRLAPGLGDGEAFFLSSHPKLRRFMPDPVRPIQLPMPWTFDSSATPGVGQRKREPKVLALADLAAIEQKMQKEVQTAKENDPKLLKAELQKLRGELQKMQSAKPAAVPAAKTEIKRVEVPVVKAKEVQRVESVIAKGTVLLGRATSAIEKLDQHKKLVSDAVGCLDNALRNARREGEPAPTPRPPPVRNNIGTSPMVPRVVTPRPQPSPKAVTATENGEEKFTDYMQDILNAAAKFDGLGIQWIPRRSLAAVADKSPRSSEWDGSLSRLRRYGYIDYGTGSTIGLLDKGRSQAEQPDTPLTSKDVIDGFINSVLDAYEGALFAHLVKVRDFITRDELSAATNKSAKSSEFDGSLSSMRKLGIIEYGPGKTVRVNPSLFIERKELVAAR